MTDKRFSLRLALVFGLVGVSALSLRGSNAEHHAHLSDDLAVHQARNTSLRARVIIHGTDEQLDALAGQHGVQIVRRLEGGAVVLANSAELASLAADETVDNLSGDVPVNSGMMISNQATGANQAWAGTSGLLGLIGGVSGVNGSGVTVAVVDSGITPHQALANKVVANVSFVTGDPSTLDAFGHGTHVAGIIAGVGGAAHGVTPLYTGGIAPGAKLVNVRVLGANGSGLTSDVIAGIQWTVANRAKYNIRVINLSLGHPVFEPSTLDPLCQAVNAAVNAGMVVVVAAGNYGLAASGAPILGGVTSPGNSMLALTVGATNTWGTVTRSDDTVATYSSRGPTRYDLAAKPDIAAPGTKIISLQANNSNLPLQYPYLHTAGGGSNAYMQLSGTSMATPMVSGAVALLLQGSPGLIPGQVKEILQSGATYMSDGGLMGAGAGNANFWASRSEAQNGLGVIVSSIVSVVTGSGAMYWDDGSMTGRLYNGTGINLLSVLQLPLVLLNPNLLGIGHLNLIGLLNPLASLPAKGLLFGQVASWTTDQQIIWGTQIYNPSGQQIIWGTGDTTQDSQIIWGTAETAPDPQ